MYLMEYSNLLVPDIVFIFFVTVISGILCDLCHIILLHVGGSQGPMPVYLQTLRADFKGSLMLDWV